MTATLTDTASFLSTSRERAENVAGRAMDVIDNLLTLDRATVSAAQILLTLSKADLILVDRSGLVIEAVEGGGK